MAITVAVKPDFSAFRMPTKEELAEQLDCDPALVEKLLENYTVLPR